MIHNTRKMAALTAVASSLLLLAPAAAFAVSIVPECARGSELAQLDCLLQTGGNIAQLILGITGALALLMFVYGGFLMLSSAGSEEKVRKGKDVLVAAVIGIFIIFLAGYLVRYGLARLGVGGEFLKTPGSPGGTSTIECPVGIGEECNMIMEGCVLTASCGTEENLGRCITGAFGALTCSSSGESGTAD